MALIIDETIVEEFGGNDRVIKLLQAKVRLLEQTMREQQKEAWIRETTEDYITSERARILGINLLEDIKLYDNLDDQKLFLDYRSVKSYKPEDPIPVTICGPTDEELDRQTRLLMAENLGLECDENGFLKVATMDEVSGVLPDDDSYVAIEAISDIETDKDGNLTKVTLAGESDPYPLVLDQHGPDWVHVKVDKNVYDITFPKELETEGQVIIEVKKRG